MWRELNFLERWNLVTGTIHAVSSFGIALVAVVGLYKVAPIIVYQVEQQQKQAQTASVAPGAGAGGSDIAETFVDDVLSWWTEQVDAHQRILDLIALQARNRARIDFVIARSQPVPRASEITSDYLVMTAALDSGQQEVVRVPVNESAVSANQYIQYKINHGAFAGLEATPRETVEGAITSYVRHFMVPSAPPAYVESDMSLGQLRQAIADSQPRRLEAIKHVRALKGIIDVGLEACRE